MKYPYLKLFMALCMALLFVPGFSQSTVQTDPQGSLIKPKQVVFVNGGQFGNKKGNVQVYTPSLGTTEKLADFEKATSVQGIVAGKRHLYVSAEYEIIKYDLITKTEVAKRYLQDTDTVEADGTGTEQYGLNHSVALYKDWLIVTRQDSFYPPEDGYNVRIYNKSDLSLVKKIPVSTGASGITVVGDSAFVAINGGYAGTSGQLAIIDLIHLEKKEEFDFHKDGKGILQVLSHGRTLYLLAEDKLLAYAIDKRSYTVHNLPIGHADFSSSPLGTAIIDGKLYSKTNWGTAPDKHKGFGITNLNNFTVENKDLIGMDTDTAITAHSYALMASAYDSLDERFYLTFGKWSGQGLGRAYDRAGNVTGSFGHVEDSPEKMVLSYAIINHAPYLNSEIGTWTVQEGDTLTLDLSTYFTDKDDEGLTYTVTLDSGDSLPSWIRRDGSLLIASPQVGTGAGTWPLKVTATDPYGATVTSGFSIRKTIVTGLSPEIALLKSIHPNPVQNWLTVQLSNTLKVNLHLIGPNGNILIHKKVRSQEEHLDLSAVPPGLYLLTVTAGEGVQRVKIIKE